MTNTEAPVLSRYAQAQADARVWLDAHPEVEARARKKGWWPACIPMTHVFGMWVTYDIMKERGLV